MVGLPEASAFLDLLSRLKEWISSDVSDIQVSLVGKQPQITRREEIEWGSILMPTDIATVSFQFTNVGDAGAHLQSVYTGDPDADLYFTKCLTGVDGGEEWQIPPGGEAVVKSFEVGFNPRMKATVGRSGEFVDVEFHFTIQDRAEVRYERSVEESVYVTPLSDL